MAANPSLTHDQVYQMSKNGYTGDATIWDQVYTYILHHSDKLFHIASNVRWSIGHQLIYHGRHELFKKLLSLYNEDHPIDISSKTKDGKTILDIAKERQTYYKEQYKFLEHLFDQDKFIQACKSYNWVIIDEMLNKSPVLLNEKPPYYSNYFIHYLVHYDDIRKFDQYNSSDNPFQLDLKNSNGKTALDLAREAKNKSFIDGLSSLLPLRDQESDAIRDEDEEDRRSPIQSPTSTNTQYTVPTPTTLSSQTKKNLTCVLTKQIFSDPVKASDGQTYERKAIIAYLRESRYSPKTGESMNNELIDDIEMKNQISRYRQQKLLP